MTNLLVNIKAEATKRKTWVTPGSNPTQVVEWTIYGTNADGTIDRVNYLVITEFQGVERWEEKDSGPRMWE